MSTLVNQVLSQADKFPMINQWLSPNEQYNNKKIESYTPRHHSLGAPPPYENVVRQPKRYSFSSMIWKRASSFSSTACSEPEVGLPMTTIDKKQVENGITLLNIATEMANSNNNKPMALDLYMMGLEKIMSALPLESDPSIKLTFERKLNELKENYQLNLVDSSVPLVDEQEKDTPIRRQLSNLVIHAAILGAVALKKSPIPDAVSGVVNYAVDKIQIIDEKHKIRKRTWDLAALSVSKAVEIDRHFEIHQMVTEAVYTGFAAFIKAGLAYAETPGYNQKQ
ncbi:hypothetical protein G6F46_008125 [Rhizopus delemar]|nr:hypothetical protein G6F43_010064 [Rhizopus delemar]KAG1550937.1 hypothetical protein G6F51_002147 [Rhizopus arrhizus]KAG1452339.1 hypothetical protein G6F55_008733 [Rhizopus delemar]KAG1494882.1 hypothetical protein G6F54_007558 [Rhizopus delemar]KAG1505373.1 hypothetical protein G6F52_012093 [Rhizopus delemar]